MSLPKANLRMVAIAEVTARTSSYQEVPAKSPSKFAAYNCLSSPKPGSQQ